jgi:hypothetical protein
MNRQIQEFFRVDGGSEPHFQAVRFLTVETVLSWAEAEKMGVPRGWFELSRISVENRIEFLKDFWLKNISFHPQATQAIEQFFAKLDDIVVLVCRQTTEDPWRSELVYSLSDGAAFFRGLVPATDEEIAAAKKGLELDLPKDYWSFSKIHNGFGRLSELGLLPIETLSEARSHLIRSIVESDKLLRMDGMNMDAYSLFPFYEEYGMGCFQCFNGQWYPGSEMGNVHFSGIDYTVSDILERREWAENLAFPTFVEWLAAFLEGINSCT